MELSKKLFDRPHAKPFYLMVIATLLEGTDED